jgi:hypothetical protein
MQTQQAGFAVGGLALGLVLRVVNYHAGEPGSGGAIARTMALGPATLILQRGSAHVTIAT